MKGHGCDKDGNNKPSPRRGRLHRYYRSAYKIFLEERRAEIINLRLREYDESVAKNPAQMLAHSTISFHQLTIEINQMWKDMSTQERDIFNARAVVETQHQRVLKQKDPVCTENNPEELTPSTTPSKTASEATWPLIGSSIPADGTIDASEFITNDLIDDDSMSIRSIDFSIEANSLVLRSDPLIDVKPGDQMQNTHDQRAPTVVDSNKIWRYPAPASPIPYQTEHIAYAMQQLPVTRSPPSDHVHQNAVFACHPLAPYHPLPMAPMPLQQSPSVFVMMGNNNLNPSSYLPGASAAVDPMSSPMSSGYIVPSSHIPHGSPFGYYPYPYHYPSTWIHSSNVGRGAPQHNYYPMSHPLYPSQSLYPPPLTGAPMHAAHNDSRIDEPGHGRVVDLSQSTTLESSLVVYESKT
jgi:hypothetical protein